MATMDPGGTGFGGQVPPQPTNVPPNSPMQQPVNLDPSLQGKLQAIRDSLSKINDESDDFVEKLGEVGAEFEGLEDTVDQLAGKRKKAAAAELSDIDVILKARLDALSKEDREQVRIEQDYQKRVALQRSAAQREVARAVGERRPSSEIEHIESGYTGRIASIKKEQAAHGPELMGSLKESGNALKDFFSSIMSTTPIKQARELGMATAEAQAAMYSAGLMGINGGAKFQGAVNAGVINPTEAQALVKTIANMSPKLMMENAQSLNAFMGVSGKFGMTVEDSMDMLGDASARVNMGTGNLIATELFAADVKTKLGMATKEATEHIINMTEAARMGGAGIDLVAGILTNFNPKIATLGVEMSKAEASRFTQNLAAGLASMSTTNLVGLTAFKNGKGLPSNAEIIESIKKPGDLLQNLFDKTIKGMPLASGLPGLEKIAGMAGVTFQGKQQELDAWEMLNRGGLKGLSTAELAKYTTQPDQINKLQTEGWEVLKNMKDPIIRMDNHLRDISKGISMLVSRGLQSPTGQKVGVAAKVIGEASDVIGAGAKLGGSAIQSSQQALKVAAEAGLL